MMCNPSHGFYFTMRQYKSSRCCSSSFRPAIFPARPPTFIFLFCLASLLSQQQETEAMNTIEQAQIKVLFRSNGGSEENQDLITDYVKLMRLLPFAIDIFGWREPYYSWMRSRERDSGAMPLLSTPNWPMRLQKAKRTLETLSTQIKAAKYKTENRKQYFEKAPFIQSCALMGVHLRHCRSPDTEAKSKSANITVWTAV